jgi:hypothetical protein
MTTTHTAGSQCLHCGRKLDALTSASVTDPVAPQPGMITVCYYCGALMKLDEQLLPRPFTDDEANEVLADLPFMQQVARLVGRIYFIKHSRS